MPPRYSLCLQVVDHPQQSTPSRKIWPISWSRMRIAFPDPTSKESHWKTLEANHIPAAPLRWRGVFAVIRDRAACSFTLTLHRLIRSAEFRPDVGVSPLRGCRPRLCLGDPLAVHDLTVKPAEDQSLPFKVRGYSSDTLLPCDIVPAISCHVPAIFCAALLCAAPMYQGHPSGVRASFVDF